MEYGWNTDWNTDVFFHPIFGENGAPRIQAGGKRWNTAIFGIRVEYGVEYRWNTVDYGLDKNTTKMDKK